MQADHMPLLLASQVAGAGSPVFPMDRIRMQKAVFLLTRRGSPEWRSMYTYEPYNWGPYSSALSADINKLRAEGSIVLRKFPGSKYSSYVSTEAGEAKAVNVWATLTTVEQEFMHQVKQYVTAKSFNKLLREVYAAYPNFASKSLFSG